MRIAKADLDEWNISALHVERDGAPPWTFVPLDEDRVQVVEPIGDDYLLALGSQQLAVWRMSDRSLVVRCKPNTFYPYLSPWFFASKRQSLFHFSSFASQLRELSFETGETRFHDLGAFKALSGGAIDGGDAIALLGATGPFDAQRIEILRLDPAAGEHAGGSRLRPVHLDVSKKQTWPSACSPDGRLVARVHLGSVAHAPAGRGRSLFGLGRPSFANHPDLQANPIQDCYGVAIELYETATGRLTHRLLAAFHTATEYQELVQRNGSWREQGQLAMADYTAAHARKEGAVLTPECLVRTWLKPGKPLFRSIIERMAERFPYDRWDGERQVVYAGDRGPAATKAERDFIDFPFGFLTDVQLAWRHDGAALTVMCPNGRERDVYLDGRVTPWREAPPTIRQRQVPEAALKAMRAEIRAKASIPIRLTELDVASCRAALDEMAQRMAAGLPALLFRDVLDWRFHRGRQRWSERQFFDHLRSFGPEERAALVPPLRALLNSYGEQARKVRPQSHDMFLSGVGSKHPEQWKAALSDAALYLAEIDAGAGPFLRGWLTSIDQEHDQTAAGKVLPAFAATSRFADEDSLRFGLFYALQQWQTPKVPIEKLGLVAAAKAQCSPAEFYALVLEEAASAGGPDEPASFNNVRALLGSGEWDREVAKLLAA
ncbi:hypothetical protein [Sphingomonas sp.]|jgi:hypothetical protein|uniref:hypothetical protein n=1 Tax=Sphingomonas sp. TaxID=28214 RepID=UPI002D7FEABC|nr:hypothetical protein [Sphingomonas sp.]HEU0044451.1 hypothetical protein [Sphingomonas sp.]